MITNVIGPICCRIPTINLTLSAALSQLKQIIKAKASGEVDVTRDGAVMLRSQRSIWLVQSYGCQDQEDFNSTCA